MMAVVQERYDSRTSSKLVRILDIVNLKKRIR